METIFSLALTFFLLVNPVGNTPTVLALVKDYPFERQKKIMLREGLIAFAIIIFFQYLGEPALSLIKIQNYAITLCGGVLLFLISLQMIFSFLKDDEKGKTKQEPFIVPIATPLLAGPGLMAIVMLKAQLEQNNMLITFALILAWIGVLGVLAMGPYLQKIFGEKGMLALEQLMGLLLCLMAIEMLVTGINLFNKAVNG